jgi:hypothetical protein
MGRQRKGYGENKCYPELAGGTGKRGRSTQKRFTSTFPKTTRNADDLDVLARSLQYLTDSAKGLQDTLKRGFAMGIKIPRLDLEKKNLRISELLLKG